MLWCIHGLQDQVTTKPTNNLHVDWWVRKHLFNICLFSCIIHFKFQWSWPSCVPEWSNMNHILNSAKVFQVDINFYGFHTWVQLMIWPKKIIVILFVKKIGPDMIKPVEKILAAELIKLDFHMNLQIAIRYLCMKKGANVIWEA